MEVTLPDGSLILCKTLEHSGEGRFVSCCLAYVKKYNQPISEHYYALNKRKRSLTEAMDYAFEGNLWQEVIEFSRTLCLPQEGFFSVHGDWSESSHRLRQAVYAAYQNNDQRALATVGGDLGWVLYKLGNTEKAIESLELLLSAWKNHSEELPAVRLVANLYERLGSIARDGGDHLKAQTYLEEAVRLKLQLNQPMSLVTAYDNLARLFLVMRHYEKANELYYQCLQIYRETGDKIGVAIILHQLGNLAFHKENNAEAKLLYEESLAIKKELGYLEGIANTFHQLGALAERSKDFLAAESLYQESLINREKMADKHGIAKSLFALGILALKQKEYTKAQNLLSQSLVMHQELKNQQGVSILLGSLAALAHLQDKWGEAEAYYAQSLTISEALNDDLGMASSLLGLARIAHVNGEVEKAHALYRQHLEVGAKVVGLPNDIETGFHDQLEFLNFVTSLIPASKHIESNADKVSKLQLFKTTLLNSKFLFYGLAGACVGIILAFIVGNFVDSPVLWVRGGGVGGLSGMLYAWWAR